MRYIGRYLIKMNAWLKNWSSVHHANGWHGVPWGRNINRDTHMYIQTGQRLQIRTRLSSCSRLIF